jgi:hypothetical protein
MVSLLLLNAATAHADSLQGHIEKSGDSLRLERSGDAPALDGHVDQFRAPASAEQTPLIDSNEFSNPSEKGSLRKDIGHVIQGKADAGQDEFWVNWDDWRHRVADAVWAPIRAQKLKIYGQTRVDYDVTRDRHIQITGVSTPDPSGASANMLANAILKLDGDPVLEFPAGSQQLIHHNVNMSLGLPLPLRQGHMIYLPGGNERIFRQW